MSEQAGASPATGGGSQSHASRHGSQPPSHDSRDSSPREEPSSGPARPRRAFAACTRCRRYRQKCVVAEVQGSEPVAPCQSCRSAGRKVASTCEEADDFSDDVGQRSTDRGIDSCTPALDTQVDNAIVASRQNVPAVATLTRTEGVPQRALPARSSVPSHPHVPARAPTSTHPAQTPKPYSPLLPPANEVVDGVRTFLYQYMQLGSFPRSIFLDQVERDTSSVNVFLLLSILALAGRFTPSLVKRFGGRQQAAEELSRRALSIVADEMIEASLERIQAFFILGTAQFGEGNGARSWLLFGIAVRMTATLNLHKESSYALPPNAAPEDVVRSETSRRTFWLVYLHDQQLAGRSPSTTFPLHSIDAVLPCDEDDFIFGQPVPRRAALPGTLAAGLSRRHDPDPSRSLFATMIIGQWLWARVAEHACKPINPHNVQPWLPDDDFAKLQLELADWESKLPPRHVFSPFLLRGMKTHSLDMGYLSISLMLRLSNIVLRRAYLPWMAAVIEPDANLDAANAAPAGFWENMTAVMVQNAITLSEQLSTYLQGRTLLEGFPAVFIFGVYMCGDIAYFLSRWPKLCPTYAASASGMLQLSLDTLTKLEEAWPLATRWRVTLQHLVATQNVLSIRTATMAHRAIDEQDSIFRDHHKRAEPIFATPTPPVLPAPEPATPIATIPHDSHLSNVQPLFDAQQSGTINADHLLAFMNDPTNTLNTMSASFDINQPQALDNTLAPLPQLLSTDPIPGAAAPELPFFFDATLDSSVLDNVNLDAFGSDLTAFLRGEPADWFGLDSDLSNVPF